MQINLFSFLKLSHHRTLGVWIFAGLAIATWALMTATPKSERMLYSDQATHVMIASSVWNDFDLRYSLEDLSRFSEDYPKETGPRGLFLKQGVSGDLHYAKPFIYGMTVAPLHAVFGVDGFVIFNIICLVAIGLIAGRVLAGPLGVGWATFVSLAFVVPSGFLPWVFVAHPDLFIAALLAIGSYILLSQKTNRGWQIVGALILGVALHEKITFLVVIPFIVWAMPEIDWRRRALIGLTVLLSWLLFTCVNLAVDGSFLSYQGLRFYVPDAPFPLEDGWIPPAKSLTAHVFDPIVVVLALIGNLSILPEKIVDFMFGRQTGILPYFALACGLLIIRPFFVWSRSALLLLGFFAYLVMHWLVFPTNGYGGGGSYGSRYMLQVLPLIPISYLGANLRGCWIKLQPSKITLKIFLLGLTFFAFIIQHRIFIEGYEAVMHHFRVITTAPLNTFRLEKWLLPSSLGAGASTQYLDEKEKWQFRIYKPNEANRDSWFKIGVHPKKLAYVLYKRDAEDKFPSVALRSPFDTNIRVLNRERVVWSGALVAGQPQVLDIDALATFRSAFDLLTSRHVSLAELVVEADLKGAEGEEKLSSVLLDFEPSTPPLFDAFGERLSAAELVSHGADLSTGWSHIEPWGVWSDGDLAAIYLKVDEGRKFLVEFDAHAFVPTERKGLKVEFRCSGSSPSEILFQPGQSKSVQLACEREPYQEYLVLTAIVYNPTSPLAEGQSTDSRRLGVGMKTFKIDLIN